MSPPSPLSNAGSLKDPSESRARSLAEAWSVDACFASITEFSPRRGERNPDSSVLPEHSGLCKLWVFI